MCVCVCVCVCVSVCVHVLHPARYPITNPHTVCVCVCVFMCYIQQGDTAERLGLDSDDLDLNPNSTTAYSTLAKYWSF